VRTDQYGNWLLEVVKVIYWPNQSDIEVLYKFAELEPLYGEGAPAAGVYVHAEVPVPSGQVLPRED
jgi:hypothetical protein